MHQAPLEASAVQKLLSEASAPPPIAWSLPRSTVLCNWTWHRSGMDGMDLPVRNSENMIQNMWELKIQWGLDCRKSQIRSLFLNLGPVCPIQRLQRVRDWDLMMVINDMLVYKHGTCSLLPPAISCSSRDLCGPKCFMLVPVTELRCLEVDEQGTYSGEFYTFALTGFIRQRGESDACHLGERLAKCSA